MSGRIAAAAVLVTLVAMCVAAPAWAGDKEDAHTIVIHTDDDGGGWLGVGIQELDKKLRQKLEISEDIVGILVTEVYDDSPAEEAGLRKHDIIISVDGEKGKDLSHFIDLIRDKDPGTTVKLRVSRDGEDKTFKAVLGERESTFVWKGIEGFEGLEALSALEHIIIPEIDIGLSSWGRKGRLGVYIEDVSGDLAEYFEIPGGEGVLVEGVVEDSPAEDAGIMAGDIIYKIDGKTICCTEELVKAISKMEADTGTPIVLIRKGDEVTVTAVVEENEYEKALQQYKVQLEDLGEHKILLKDYESLDEETRAELKEQLEELKEELEELREEIKELSTDRD